MEVIKEGQTNKRAGRRLILLCAFAYFISYLTRVDLAAVLVAVEETGFSVRNDAVLALALTSAAYGAGQFVSGWLGDRFDPRRVAACGLVLTAACNITAGCFGGAALPALWALNGLAQSLFWPPIVRILSANLPKPEYDKACVWVNWGGSFGTMAVYLILPLVIKALGIRAVFAIAGGAALAAVAVWAAFSRRYSVGAAELHGAVNVPQRGAQGKSRAAVFALIMCAILLQGALRDGITNWLPTYVNENFGIDSSSAVLSGALLPVCGALAYIVTQFIHKRLIKNELLCAAAVFSACAASAALLRFFAAGNVFVSVVCLAVAAGSMHGVNLILICIIPPFFAVNGRVALVSGIMNAGVYIGSAFATYCVPLVTGSYGKNGYLDLCLAAALCGAAFCAAASVKWRAKNNGSKENGICPNG